MRPLALVSPSKPGARISSKAVHYDRFVGHRIARRHRLGACDSCARDPLCFGSAQPEPSRGASNRSDRIPLLHRLGKSRPPAIKFWYPTAAGRVGSFVGQLARIAGCRPWGSRGGTRERPNSAAHVTDNEEMIDYPPGTPRHPACDQRACPQGNDIFFDNTGGIISDGGNSICVLRPAASSNGRTQAANAIGGPSPTGPRQEREIILTRACALVGFHYPSTILPISGGGGRTYASCRSEGDRLR